MIACNKIARSDFYGLLSKRYCNFNICMVGIYQIPSNNDYIFGS